MKASKNIFVESQKDKRFGHRFVDYYVSSSGYGRKKRPRIRYLGWAEGEVEFFSPFEERSSLIQKDVELEKKVERALGKLTEEERKLILYFYYDCFSYEKISEILGKEKYKLEKIHKDAKEKLKILLRDYVEKRFGISTRAPDCIICRSPHRKKLEELIKKKRNNQTWSGLIKLFKRDFGIEIKTPQILISHQRKHMVG